MLTYTNIHSVRLSAQHLRNRVCPIQYKNKGVKALITNPGGLSSVPRTHEVEKEKTSRKLSTNFSMLPVLHPYAYAHTRIHKINISALLKGILTKKYI